MKRVSLRPFIKHMEKDGYSFCDEPPLSYEQHFIVSKDYHAFSFLLTGGKVVFQTSIFLLTENRLNQFEMLEMINKLKKYTKKPYILERKDEALNIELTYQKNYDQESFKKFLESWTNIVNENSKMQNLIIQKHYFASS